MFFFVFRFSSFFESPDLFRCVLYRTNSLLLPNTVSLVWCCGFCSHSFFCVTNLISEFFNYLPVNTKIEIIITYAVNDRTYFHYLYLLQCNQNVHQTHRSVYQICKKISAVATAIAAAAVAACVHLLFIHSSAISNASTAIEATIMWQSCKIHLFQKIAIELIQRHFSKKLRTIQASIFYDFSLINLMFMMKLLDANHLSNSLEAFIQNS